jgi:phage baseplate assembly protein gpV
VQFHWDREGKKNADSSCWVRVTQPWADKGFGMICLPRVGQEVVVTFEEGDPDRPLILGSVYNADNPPPFKLPENRMFSGIKTNSVLGNPAQNFSGLAFNDTPQGEHVALYAEKDLMVNAENNHVHHVGNYQYASIGQKSLTRVGSLPGVGGGGGGSGGGGGPDGATGSTKEGDTVESGLITSIAQDNQWQTSPVALPTFGFGGTTVYGINSQDTCGFMHQVTFGQATQIVVDPVGLLSLIPALQPFLSTVPPVGGNQQLYWGTNYQSVYGPSTSYCCAGQNNFTGKPSGPTIAMAITIPALWAAYEITYAAMDDSKKTEAGIVAVAFSAALVISNALLITFQKMDEAKTRLDNLTALGQSAAKLAETYVATASPTMLAALSQLVARTTLSTNQLEMSPAMFGLMVPLAIKDAVHNITFNDGDWLTYARNFHLFAWQPTDSGEPTSSIYICASGQNVTGGSVIIDASKQVTLTSGVAYLGLENKESSGGNLTMQCGMTGKISLQRMPEEVAVGPPVPPFFIQNIKLAPLSISIQAGLGGKISLTSSAIAGVKSGEISLSPAGAISLTSGDAKTGGCSIALDPITGITMQCMDNSIKINKLGIQIGGLIIKTTAKIQKITKTQLEQINAALSDLTRNMAGHK